MAKLSILHSVSNIDRVAADHLALQRVLFGVKGGQQRVTNWMQLAATLIGRVVSDDPYVPLGWVHLSAVFVIAKFVDPTAVWIKPDPSYPQRVPISVIWQEIIDRLLQYPMATPILTGPPAGRAAPASSTCVARNVKREGDRFICCLENRRRLPVVFRGF